MPLPFVKTKSPNFLNRNVQLKESGKKTPFAR